MPGRDQFNPRPSLALGTYRHYKGGKYEIVTLACDEATHEWLVIYRALYDAGSIPNVWARTYKDFTEMVVTEQGKVPRFTKIEG